MPNTPRNTTEAPTEVVKTPTKQKQSNGQKPPDSHMKEKGITSLLNPMSPPDAETDHETI